MIAARLQQEYRDGRLAFRVLSFSTPGSLIAKVAMGYTTVDHQEDRMKKSIPALLLLLVLASPLHAAGPLAKVTELRIIKDFLGHQVKLLEAKDLGQLYEVVAAPSGSEKQVFYVTKDGAYIIFGGNLYNREKENLTKERLEQINKVDISKLPLQDAIVIKRGNGEKKLIEFTDVDCPYCRKANDWLKTQTDYTLYVFLYPLDMHPKAREKSIRILCDKDPAAAFELVQTDQELTADKCEMGEKTLQKHQSVATEVGLSGTPVFVTENGSRITGFAQKSIEGYLRK